MLIFHRKGSQTRCLPNLDQVQMVGDRLVWFRKGRKFGTSLSMQHLCAHFDSVIALRGWDVETIV